MNTAIFEDSLPAMQKSAHAVVAGPGSMVFVSGQTGIDPNTGELMRGDAASQAERALKNTAVILAAAGCTLSDVVKVTVYVSSLDMIDKIDAMCEQYFTSLAHTRTTVQVAALKNGAYLSIDVIAVKTT